MAVERALAVAPGDAVAAQACTRRGERLRQQLRAQPAAGGEAHATLLVLAGLVGPVAQATRARRRPAGQRELDEYLDAAAQAAVDALHAALAVPLDDTHALIGGRARAAVVSVTLRMMIDHIAQHGGHQADALNAVLLGRHLERVATCAARLMGRERPAIPALPVLRRAAS